ncbi:MAG: nucleotidyltransferase domain-containing protein, partial [Lentisphaeria bacterium]|nr:nucleotidyltransferase domain-containing protein [Lentisphaeria bacterium]
MCQLDELRKHRDEIYRIARKNKAGKLYVFGSCARQEETPGSDVDFLADFQDGASLFDHIGLRLELAEYLKRPVDIISLKALKNETF